MASSLEGGRLSESMEYKEEEGVEEGFNVLVVQKRGGKRQEGGGGGGGGGGEE